MAMSENSSAMPRGSANAGRDDARPAGQISQAGVADYFALMKPRVMSLVVFTGLVGLMAAPGTVHPLSAIVALLAITVGAGAAGALNMWYDADIDGQMQRTAARPIPRGRVLASEALSFGTTMAAGSVFVMGVLVNWVAAALLALTIGFYLFVYTMWLKRRTPYNIVIGGAAGAFPPMIGWAAVTGGVSLESITLFAIIFIWTPPHFWALALYRTRDYKRAQVPMLPVVAGVDETRKQILLYSLALVPLAFAPMVLGFAGWLYGAIATVMGAGFLIGSVMVYRTREGAAADRVAKKFFAYSILYLFALFAGMLVEDLIGGASL